MVYPEHQDLIIFQNATFNPQFTWRDYIGNVYDLSEYTAKMEIRTSVNALDPPAVSLTTENGGIILSSTSPNITLFLSDVDTQALTITCGVYSLLLVSSSNVVDEILRGKIKVEPNATKS